MVRNKTSKFLNEEKEKRSLKKSSEEQRILRMKLKPRKPSNPMKEGFVKHKSLYLSKDTRSKHIKKHKQEIQRMLPKKYRNTV